MHRVLVEEGRAFTCSWWQTSNKTLAFLIYPLHKNVTSSLCEVRSLQAWAAAANSTYTVSAGINNQAANQRLYVFLQTLRFLSSPAGTNREQSHFDGNNHNVHCKALVFQNYSPHPAWPLPVKLCAEHHSTSMCWDIKSNFKKMQLSSFLTLWPKLKTHLTHSPAVYLLQTADNGHDPLPPLPTVQLNHRQFDESRWLKSMWR